MGGVVWAGWSGKQKGERRGGMYVGGRWRPYKVTGNEWAEATSTVHLGASSNACYEVRTRCVHTWLMLFLAVDIPTPLAQPLHVVCACIVCT